MSLLTQKAQECALINRTFQPDGSGGSKATYTEGDRFEAAIVVNSDRQDHEGDKKGLKRSYTVITRRTTTLTDNQLFKRLEDGAVFRVKTDGNDRKTPDTACLDMRAVYAEDYKL